MSGKTEHPRVVAIIQARMGSSRLPGQVLASIQGNPMLWHVVERTRAAHTLDEVMVATTTRSVDDAIVDFCGEQGVAVFRGSEDDVLQRYYQAALEVNADVVVRITSDCPLIDPQIVDKTVLAYLETLPDYAANTILRTYPRGLDTEVISFQALERAHREAHKAYERAHVTPYIYENPREFSILSVTGEQDYSQHRWTVDTPEDLEFVRAIYDRAGEEMPLLNDILHLVEREPDLMRINSAIEQKALHEC